MVLPNGASSEGAGTFKATLAPLVGALPGVARDASGDPLVAPQFVVDIRLRRVDGTTATALMRGVTPEFWRLTGHTVRIASGRHFRPGHDELIAGVAAARGFVALAPGDSISIHRAPWRVSGEFSANGGIWESELWTDLAALQSTYHAQGSLATLWVELTSPAAFNVFNTALRNDPRTQGLHAVVQPVYYEQQTAFLRWFVRIAAAGIALALGLGAILAVVNALGMALDARRRELAILRTIGFRRVALATALLIEVLVIGAACAGLATLIGWLTVNGHEVGSSTFSGAIQFRLRVDAGVVGWTLAYLLLVGALAAAWPIARALRAPLTRALQEE